MSPLGGGTIGTGTLGGGVPTESSSETSPSATEEAFLSNFIVVADVQKVDFIVKDPEALVPMGFDWTSRLTRFGAGVTIEDSAWSVSPDTLDLSDDSIVNGSLKTQLRMDGGTLGQVYRLTNHIVASSGDEDDRSFRVLIQEQ